MRIEARGNLPLNTKSVEQELQINAFARNTMKQVKHAVSAIETLQTIGEAETRLAEAVTVDEEQDAYIPQDSIASLLLSDEMQQLGWDYFVGALRVYEKTDLIRGAFDHYRDLIDYANYDEDDREKFDIVFSIGDKIEEKNPLFEGRYSRYFFWDIADAVHPLTDRYRETLDEVFEETNEPVDAAMMAFFQYNDTKSEMMGWKKGITKKQEAFLGARYDLMTRSIQRYFQHYRDEALHSRFQDDEHEQSIFPPEAPALPIATAVSFMNHTELFPTTVNTLLADNTFPMSEEAASVIADRYAEKFYDNHESVLSRTDVHGNTPYMQVLETDLQGNDIHVWETLIQDKSEEVHSEEVNDALTWLGQSYTYKTLRNALGDSIHTFPLRQEGFSLSVSAYGDKRIETQRLTGIQPTIDVIVKHDNGDAVMLQVQPEYSYNGKKYAPRIYGIPKEMEKDAQLAVSGIMDEVKAYLEASVLKQKTKEPPARREVPRKEVQVIFTGMTREERMASYAEKQLRAKKRKQLMKPESETASSPLVPDTSVSEDKPFTLTLLPSADFSEDLSMLPVRMQERVNRILTAVQHDRKLMKPLRKQEEDAPNMYTVRMGDYRIILVQSGSGEMVLSGIRPRGIAYQDLSKDIALLEQFSQQ